MANDGLYGAIEAGGTKFILAVASDAEVSSVIERIQVPTERPDTTLATCHDFFARHAAGSGLRAIGIGTFGPVNLEPGTGYGTIVRTPKPFWSDVSLVRALEPLGVPVVVDTDVNGAALAEARNLGVDRLVYITVGTGIGGGLVVDGRPVTGRPHPELGHITVERHPDDTYAGSCPHHGACAEGLACGPALEDRFGVSKGGLGDVPDAVVPLAGWYVGQIAATANYVVAPDRVVVGGGITSLPGVFDAVVAEAHRRVGTYTLRHDDEPEWLIEPSLGANSGLAGALLLAETATP